MVAFNRPARALFPALRAGELLALILRSPDVLDAVVRVDASGRSETVPWRERVPVERIFDVKVAPLDLPTHDRSIVLTLRDLTEAHRVERMRVDFVANASHELRTPLASLLGFVETLQGAARDDAPRPRALSGDHARPGPPHGPPRRGPAVALAYRAEPAPAAGDAGRSGRRCGPCRRHAGADGA